MKSQPIIRFAVVGLNHDYIYNQVNALLQAGAKFVSFYNKDCASELALQAKAQAQRLGNLKDE